MGRQATRRGELEDRMFSPKQGSWYLHLSNLIGRTCHDMIVELLDTVRAEQGTQRLQL